MSDAKNSTEQTTKILAQMAATGAPLVVSAQRFRRWRTSYGNPALGLYQVGVSPALSREPGAYKAAVAGYQVSIRVALRLMKQGKIKPRRKWFVKGIFDRVVQI